MEARGAIVSQHEFLHGGAAVPEVTARAWRPREYLRAYIGENWDGYAGVFDAIEKKKGIPASWSWAAFFIPWIWLVYRKRYAWAAGIFVAMHVAQYFVPLSALAISILLGIFGKALYVRSALAAIEHIMTLTPDQHERVVMVKARGGVSDRAVMIIVCVAMALWVIALGALVIAHR